MSSSGSEDGHAEGFDRGGGGRRKRGARPLDEAALRDLALSYVARFSTTAAKLETYLARKIRERGVAEDGEGRTSELDVTGLVTGFVEAGYVDDDAYARARSRDLTARGYGGRRVEQALWAAGVEEGVRADHAPDEAQARHAAALLARKRRFGPFARPEGAEDADGFEGVSGGDPDERRKLREKQVAAMLRAGHSYEHAAFIVDASARSEIEDWLAVAGDPDHSNGGLW